MSQRSVLMARARWFAAEVGLSDDERHELAMMLPTRRGASGPISWGQLTNEEVAVLCSWLRGVRLVDDLRRLR